MSSIKAISKSLGLLKEKVKDSTQGFLRTAKGLVKVQEEADVAPKQTPRNTDTVIVDKSLDRRNIEAPRKVSPRESSQKKFEQAGVPSLSETPAPPQKKRLDATGSKTASPLPSEQQLQKPVPAPRKKSSFVPTPKPRLLSLKSSVTQQPIPARRTNSASDRRPSNNVKDSLLERCEHLAARVKDLDEYSRTGDSTHGEALKNMQVLHDRLCIDQDSDDARIAQSKANVQYWKGRVQLRPVHRLKQAVMDNVSDNASKVAKVGTEFGKEVVKRAKYGYRPLNPSTYRTAHKKVTANKIDPVVEKVLEEIENVEKLIKHLESELEASPNQRYLAAKEAFKDKLQDYQNVKERLAKQHLLQQQLQSAKNTLFERLNIEGHDDYGLETGMSEEYVSALEVAIETIDMRFLEAKRHLHTLKDPITRRWAEKLSSSFRRYCDKSLQDKSFRLEMKRHLDTLNAQERQLKHYLEREQSEYEALKKELTQAADTLVSEKETYMTSEQCINVIAQRKNLEAAREIKENFNKVCETVYLLSSYKNPGKTLASLVQKERKYERLINKNNHVDDETRKSLYENKEEINELRQAMKLYYLIGIQYDLFPKKKKNKKEE